MPCVLFFFTPFLFLLYFFLCVFNVKIVNVMRYLDYTGSTEPMGNSPLDHFHILQRVLDQAPKLPAMAE